MLSVLSVSMADHADLQARLAKCDLCEEVFSVMTRNEEIARYNEVCDCPSPAPRILQTSDVAELEELRSS